MAGYCTTCGIALGHDGQCPDCDEPRVETAQDIGVGAAMSTAPESPLTLASAQSIGALPKASTSRRLLGSGIEYFAYSAFILFLNILSPLTGGLLGYFAIPVLLAMVGLRDVNSGMFSLGKRVGRLRVVDFKSGQPASNSQGLRRNIYYLVAIFLMIFPFVKLAPSTFFGLFLFIDLMMIIASPDGRRIGDLIAGTQVVHEARSS